MGADVADLLSVQLSEARRSLSAPRNQKAPPCRAFSDGARRIRTADLLGAIQALCQLSYSPEVLGWEVDPTASQEEG
jgi:hypothetical protein